MAIRTMAAGAVAVNFNIFEHGATHHFSSGKGGLRVWPPPSWCERSFRHKNCHGGCLWRSCCRPVGVSARDYGMWESILAVSI